jgi:hypothetical protein
VAFLRGFLRVYSWIFETILSLMALAMGVVATAIGTKDVQLGWLPWTGKTLLAWLVALGLLGLFCVAFAITGRLRIMLFLFSLVAFILLAKGFFQGTYSFAGPEQGKNALILVVGAFLAVIGAWPGGRATARRK